MIDKIEPPKPDLIYKRKDPLGFRMVKVYKNDSILRFMLKNRIKAQSKKQDSLYLVCGLEGSGKSLFTLMAYDIYAELKGESTDVSHVARNVDELMDQYAILQRNQFVTLDEAQELASDRWNEKKSKEIKEKFTVMRERAFVSFICYPNPLKVSIYFREDRVRGVFFITKPGCAYYYANSPENTHFADILDTWSKFNKTRSLKKFTRYAPEFIMYYPEYVGILRQQYDQRKDENISKVLGAPVVTSKIPDNYMTIEEAAKLGNWSKHTVNGYVNSDKLQRHYVGVKMYVLREDVETIIENKKNKRHKSNAAIF